MTIVMSIFMFTMNRFEMINKKNIINIDTHTVNFLADLYMYIYDYICLYNMYVLYITNTFYINIRVGNNTIYNTISSIVLPNSP